MAPRLSYPGSSAIPTVALPSRNSAMVSLGAMPQRRCMTMPNAVPTGRAINASANTAKAASMPSSVDRNGKKTCGNTSTQAMPKTKKSKYSDARPMITPAAISPGVTSSSRWTGGCRGTAPDTGPECASPVMVQISSKRCTTCTRLDSRQQASFICQPCRKRVCGDTEAT